jgi:hypothetical protein
MSGRNTTLVTAKQAITKPTLNGVPPNEVMKRGNVGCSSACCAEPKNCAQQSKANVGVHSDWDFPAAIGSLTQ